MVATNIEENEGHTSVFRRQKGAAEKISIRCPNVIAEYNKAMGGVDLLDQRKSYYEVDRKSKFRFYLRIFFDLMDVACVNAFIIYNERFPNKLSLLQFKRCVADGLTRHFSSRKRKFPGVRHVETATLRPTGNICHMPIFQDSRHRCVNCKKLKLDHKTSVLCSTCNISLCLVKERNCFREFHSNI